MMIAKLTGPVRRKLLGTTVVSREVGRTSDGAGSGFFKVIRMGVKQLCLIVLLLSIGCQQASVGQGKLSRPAEGTVAEARVDTQLQLNKEVLINERSSQQMRLDAASLLLSSKNPLARKILLNVLRQSENSAARAAVCRALSNARAKHKTIEKSEEFVAPLLEILQTEQGPSTAKLAAEAVLIFEYEQISEPLGKMAVDASLPVRARLNAIYALKLQPDMGAIFKLMELLDDSEMQVAAASEEALKALGIPVGGDAEARRQIKDELKRKGRDKFLRDWLIRQEAQMRVLETELNSWKKLYVDALDEIYIQINEDEAKGKLLAKHLRSSEVVVRVWAVDKVREWRGTTPKLPDELGPILVNLVSDENRDVRLKVANLLFWMGELDSAEKLLEQLRIEQDDGVAIEIFVALGVAVSYPRGADSQIKISPEQRKETLEWAGRYLAETDLKKSQKGAEVIKKLLEQDGLASADIEKYLELLAERYKQEIGKVDGTLRGELLSTMAGLCAQGSACKADAAKLFGPLFEEALGDTADMVREAAVDGLIYIGKTRMLLRKGDLVNDPSIEVRKKLVNLASEIGGKEDLVWLWGKIGSTAEGDPAWEAMLKILNRSEAAVLSDWIGRFNSLGAENKLSVERKLSVLEIAEQKAMGGENKAKMLKDTREQLAKLYTRIGDFERAAKYFGMLHDAAAPDEKEAIVPDLLDVYLRWRNVEMAAKVVDNCLLRNDLDSNSPVVVAIEGYLDEPPPGADPNMVLRELVAEVEHIENRPKWQKQLERWFERLGQAEALDKPEEGST